MTSFPVLVMQDSEIVRRTLSATACLVADPPIFRNARPNHSGAGLAFRHPILEEIARRRAEIISSEQTLQVSADRGWRRGIPFVTRSRAIQLRFHPIQTRHLIAHRAPKRRQTWRSTDCAQEQIARGIIALFNGSRAKVAQFHSAFADVGARHRCILEQLGFRVSSRVQRAAPAQPTETVVRYHAGELAPVGHLAQADPA